VTASHADHTGGHGHGHGGDRPLLGRLAAYHQIAAQAGELGRTSISSAHLADLLGIDPSLVRKDLASAGIVGRPKVGFDLAEVLAHLEQVLGLTSRNDAILIGCGHLGTALAGYPGFGKYGLKLVAVFDSDATKVGLTVAGLTVLPMEKCRSIIEIFRVRIAILAVPGSAAQSLTDWLAARGVRAIWNFAPVVLNVPTGVVVRDENLALGLARLLHNLSQLGPAAPQES
jgi:redox-sensing transcriptional repressor